MNSTQSEALSAKAVRTTLETMAAGACQCQDAPFGWKIPCVVQCKAMTARQALQDADGVLALAFIELHRGPAVENKQSADQNNDSQENGETLQHRD